MILGLDPNDDLFIYISVDVYFFIFRTLLEVIITEKYEFFLWVNFLVASVGCDACDWFRALK